MTAIIQQSIDKHSEGVYKLNPNVSHHDLVDAALERLTKLESLMAVINLDDFLDFDQHTVKNYFWTMQELLAQTIEISEILYRNPLADNR